MQLAAYPAAAGVPVVLASLLAGNLAVAVAGNLDVVAWLPCCYIPSCYSFYCPPLLLLFNRPCCCWRSYFLVVSCCCLCPLCRWCDCLQLLSLLLISLLFGLLCCCWCGGFPIIAGCSCWCKRYKLCMSIFYSFEIVTKNNLQGVRLVYYRVIDE
jgi:hypothetical protein